MTELRSKTFDCVRGMRQIRERLSEEMGDLSYEELVHWLRSHGYSDPFLQRLAERAARPASDGPQQAAPETPLRT
jgi:hypothetical protein